MLCPNCETDNRDGAKFCDQCGFPLADAQVRDAAGTEERVRIDQFDSDATVGMQTQQDAEPAPKPNGDANELAGPSSNGPVTPNDGDVNREHVDAQAAADVTQAMGHKDWGGPSLDADLAGFDFEVNEYGEGIAQAGYGVPQAAYHDGGTMQMPRVEGEDAPASRDFRASQTADKPKRNLRPAIIALVLVAVVAAVIVLATYQMQVWGGKAVPDVTGMTEADARSILIDAGFEVRSEQVKSDDIEGLVLIMDPSAGQRKEQGSEVVIHIATSRTVPNVVGKKKSEASKLLADEGYENIKFTEKSSDKDKDTVLATNPKAGSRAKSTSEITVKVAKPYTVPDVAGSWVDDAIASIVKADLGYEVVYYDTSDYAEGTVVSTDPAAGTEVKKGAYIVLNVAQSRENKLIEIVQGYLSPGATVTLGDTSYTIESLDSVTYEGDNVVAYSATGRPFMFFFGQMVEAPAQELNGFVTFTDDGEISSIS